MSNKLLGNDEETQPSLFIWVSSADSRVYELVTVCKSLNIRKLKTDAVKSS